MCLCVCVGACANMCIHACTSIFAKTDNLCERVSVCACVCVCGSWSLNKRPNSLSEDLIDSVVGHDRCTNAFHSILIAGITHASSRFARVVNTSKGNNFKMNTLTRYFCIFTNMEFTSHTIHNVYETLDIKR